VQGSEGLAARGGRQLTANGGERAVSGGDGSGIEATPSPGSSLTTISVEKGTLLTTWNYVEVVVGSKFVLFFFFAYSRTVNVPRMNIIYSSSMYRYL